MTCDKSLIKVESAIYGLRLYGGDNMSRNDRNDSLCEVNNDTAVCILHESYVNEVELFYYLMICLEENVEICRVSGNIVKSYICV